MSPKLLADLIGFLPGGGLGGLAGVFAGIYLGLSDPWVLGALGGIAGASISFMMTSVEEEKTRKIDQARYVAQYSYLATDGRWLCKQCPTRMEFEDPWGLLGHLKWHQDPDASMSGRSEVEAFVLANAGKTLLSAAPPAGGDSTARRREDGVLDGVSGKDPPPLGPCSGLKVDGSACRNSGHYWVDGHLSCHQHHGQYGPLVSRP